MLIRVATTRAEIPRVGEGIAFIHGEIQPKISAIDGNQGFAMAVDHSSKRYVGIAAWTDSEALYGSESNASGLIADLARHLHGSKPSVEVLPRPRSCGQAGSRWLLGPAGTARGAGP
jgi:hypothetical protein